MRGFSGFSGLFCLGGVPGPDVGFDLGFRRGGSIRHGPQVPGARGVPVLACLLRSRLSGGIDRDVHPGCRTRTRRIGDGDIESRRGHQWRQDPGSGTEHHQVRQERVPPVGIGTTGAPRHHPRPGEGHVGNRPGQCGQGPFDTTVEHPPDGPVIRSIDREGCPVEVGVVPHSGRHGGGGGDVDVHRGVRTPTQGQEGRSGDIGDMHLVTVEEPRDQITGRRTLVGRGDLTDQADRPFRGEEGVLPGVLEAVGGGPVSTPPTAGETGGLRGRRRSRFRLRHRLGSCLCALHGSVLVGRRFPVGLLLRLNGRRLRRRRPGRRSCPVR